MGDVIGPLLPVAWTGCCFAALLKLPFALPRSKHPASMTAIQKKLSVKRDIVTRVRMVLPLMSSQRWSLDFVSDQLTDGRRFRMPIVVDDCTRECLALIADTSLSGAGVARELAALFNTSDKPQTVVSDNVLAREQNAV